MKTNLDLNLPFSETPLQLPPVLDNNAYLKFIEFNLRTAAANNTLEGLIAARPRPNPEWFTLKDQSKLGPAAPSDSAHFGDPDVHPSALQVEHGALSPSMHLSSSLNTSRPRKLAPTDRSGLRLSALAQGAGF